MVMATWATPGPAAALVSSACASACRRWGERSRSSASQATAPRCARRFRWINADPGRGRMSNIKVMLVDDHAVVRMGFCLLLKSTEDIDVVAEVGNGEEACRLY